MKKLLRVHLKIGKHQFHGISLCGKREINKSSVNNSLADNNNNMRHLSNRNKFYDPYYTNLSLSETILMITFCGKSTTIKMCNALMSSNDDTAPRW